MKRSTLNVSLAVAVILSAEMYLFAQLATVDERNVRAQMTFLAGDAMQGRGSGTQFEWITAEYVGSQFMSFGLEPAGHNGFDGKPGYVQSINISRGGFIGMPTLNVGDKQLTHGGEMLILRTNVGAATGKLQKLTSGSPVGAGSAVFFRPSSGQDQRAVMQEMQRILASGASIVIVEETPQWRAGWNNTANRAIRYLIREGNVKPAVLVVINSEAAKSLDAAADGTTIEFGGKPSAVETTKTWNAIGKLAGIDPTLSSEVIVLSSHLDHVGIRPDAPGDDKIFNGADDDASGTVAVMELARIYASGPRPKRTVYFVAYGSEEAGGHGSQYFVDNLPFPKEKLIANLQFEMIGRPDGKVKPDELWLTGYERSDLGPELAKRGAKLVQDPHPDQNFFQRSDNYTLARQGIIAHTVSSFGLHTDYHRASDELKTIDFGYMTKAINSLTEPVRWLLNSDFRPQWVEGKKP